MTPEGLFEPTVMFFGLSNSLVVFQTVINKILQDLINTKKVASFIDDVIAIKEEKEGYRKVVEECYGTLWTLTFSFSFIYFS